MSSIPPPSTADAQAPIALGIDIGGTSAKAALLQGATRLWSSRSKTFARPDRAELIGAVRDLLAGAPRAPIAQLAAIGVCAPGLVDPLTGLITKAVNVPGLVGLAPADLARRALLGAADKTFIHACTDAHAAACDVVHSDPFAPKLRDPGPGRVLAISIGTGVGACVLDPSALAPDDASSLTWSPLIVSGRGPGHLGQLDVTVQDSAPIPIGPDGGRGSLEAYIGLPALRARYGPDLGLVLERARWTVTDPPLAALVKALRISHAIYRPRHTVLLGGVGIRLAGLVPALHAAVRDGLTNLAQPDWTLSSGTSDHHAALGAARLALTHAISKHA